MNFDFLKNEDLETGGILVIMVGPPGSGKTTIAKQLVSEYNFERVSPDDIRKDLTGDASDQTRNDDVFSIVYTNLEDLLMDKKNVVYDATNCRNAYRYKIMSVTKALSNKIICFCSTTSIVDCLERNSNRDRFVPEDVIERMYFSLKKHPPVIFEGYDMIVGF